jgi:broad specificity phosphatase PhoE
MSDPSRIPQTNRIVLVRHAQSRVDRASHPREWGLTEDGRAAARRLAALGLFDRASGFYAGPEPKMRETLAPLAAAHGHEVHAEAALAETESEGWLGDGDFRTTVRRFFDAPHAAPAPGWEAAGQAVARFNARAEALRAVHAPQAYRGHALPGTFVVASGGRLLTAYLASQLGLSAAQAFETWSRLRMPDLAVLELSATAPPRLVIPFGVLVV